MPGRIFTQKLVALHESAIGRYCCKSPKLPGANFLAVKKSDRRPPIDVASITLPRSPANLSSGDEVPHIFTRNSRVQPKEILITSAKKTFATKSAISGLVRAAKPVVRLPGQAHNSSDVDTSILRRDSLAVFIIPPVLLQLCTGLTQL